MLSSESWLGIGRSNLLLPTCGACLLLVHVLLPRVNDFTPGSTTARTDLTTCMCGLDCFDHEITQATCVGGNDGSKVA